jgi:hypothetical protein
VECSSAFVPCRSNWKPIMCTHSIHSHRITVFYVFDAPLARYRNCRMHKRSLSNSHNTACRGFGPSIDALIFARRDWYRRWYMLSALLARLDRCSRDARNSRNCLTRLHSKASATHHHVTQLRSYLQVQSRVPWSPMRNHRNQYTLWPSW